MGLEFRLGLGVGLGRRCGRHNPADSNGVAAIAIDTNADGIVDGTMSTAWELLN